MADNLSANAGCLSLAFGGCTPSQRSSHVRHALALRVGRGAPIGCGQMKPTSKTRPRWKKLKELLRRKFRAPPVEFPEAFGRAIAPLSVRARNVLFYAAVRDLDVFLRLTYSGVLQHRNCGKKTAAEIIALQESLRRQSGQASPAPFTVLCDKLSVRANHTLQDLAVDSLDAFMALDEGQLLARLACGKKTAAEILGLQAVLRLQPPPGQSEPISYDGAPPEVFDAVRGRLTVRGVHTLESLGVHSLTAFMALDRGRLMQRRDCGRKTADHIQGLQEGIASFARENLSVDRAFALERLLEAPCLFGTAPAGLPEPSSGGYLADADNPAPWLACWVHELADDERHARVFLLRMGMLGAPSMTLEAVAREQAGLTRERIRQMQKKVATKAAAPYQQRRLRPLVEECARVVAQHGGLVDLADLTEAVLCRGRDAGQLQHATAFTAFLAELAVWRRAGLGPPRNGIVSDLSHPVPDTPIAPTRRRAAKRRSPRRPPFPVYTQSHLDLDSGFDPDDLTI